MSTSYSVVFTDFTERHFIKSFKKKYKNAVYRGYSKRNKHYFCFAGLS